MVRDYKKTSLYYKKIFEFQRNAQIYQQSTIVWYDIWQGLFNVTEKIESETLVTLVKWDIHQIWKSCFITPIAEYVLYLILLSMY